MSAADVFEKHIYDVIHREITGVADEDTSDIYALSFWVYADEDDPRRQVVDFNYNTTSKAKDAEEDASDPDEAKWNFAFWLQNEVVLIGDEDDTAGSDLRSAWLNERGLNYTDEDEESDSDRCMELAEQIDDEFWQMCARVGRRLHDAGVISSKFAKPIPIIIHNLEYDDEGAAITRDANPVGVVDEFVKWVDEM